MSQCLCATRCRSQFCAHVFATLRFALIGLCLALLSSCTLISRPEPAVTLQLPLGENAMTWPDQLEPGKVTAASALQSDRVLVAQGALLMQHEGLRWVDVPAVMLSEQFRVRLTGTETSAMTDMPAGATLDVWLTEFNIRIADGGIKTVVVSASGELRCAGDARRLRIAPAGASHSLTGADAAEIAAAFAQATDEMLTALLSTASTRASACGESAPPVAPSS